MKPKITDGKTGETFDFSPENIDKIGEWHEKLENESPGFEFELFELFERQVVAEPALKDREAFACRILKGEGFSTDLKELEKILDDEKIMIHGMDRQRNNRIVYAARVLYYCAGVRDAIAGGEVNQVAIRAMKLGSYVLWLNHTILEPKIDRGGGAPLKTAGEKGELIKRVYSQSRGLSYNKERAYKKIQKEYSSAFDSKISRTAIWDFLVKEGLIESKKK